MKLKIIIFLFFLIIPSLSFSQSCSFTIGRIKYSGGGDWYTDPTSLENLLKFIGENTNIKTAKKNAVVSILNEDLFSYPYLYITGHGNIRFSAKEVERLRKYLINGGFLHADDCYGMDKSFRREMKKVFPEQDFIELPFSHKIYHSFYDFPDGLPKIHEHDGGPPHGYGIYYEGRLVVFYSFNTDLGDGWEDPDVHNDPPEKRLSALKMGTNIVVYALTN
ncbi:hypothetical protein DRQ09_03010 [candidate division KSB1 bacterium]|nr:MAG: hypothetical protein DRQ09_03010 [candidate division KSB1 bacterium]